MPGVYDPREWRTHVIYVLHDAKNPELTAGSPGTRNSVDRQIVEDAAEMAGEYRHHRRRTWCLRSLPALRTETHSAGRRECGKSGTRPQRRGKESVPPEEASDERDADSSNGGSFVTRPGRLVHWLAALSYIYLMLTGLAFWSPWLFWIAVLFGGGTVSRELHPGWV